MKIPDGDFSNYIIPSSVTSVSGTFDSWTKLTTAPTIPSSVTYMAKAFYGCTSLAGTIEIKANIDKSNIYCYQQCFYNTIEPITLTGSSSALNTLKGTASNGNVTVAQ